MEEDPFPGLSIDSADFLDELEERQLCPKCDKSRKFYCYSCYIPMPGLEDRIPKVKLPVKIDVIKHIQEVDGKCTSAPAAVIAGEDMTVYTYPNIPDYNDKDKVLIVFPGKTSLTLEQYAKKFSPVAKSRNRINSGSSDAPIDIPVEKLRSSSSCVSSADQTLPQSEISEQVNNVSHEGEEPETHSLNTEDGCQSSVCLCDPSIHSDILKSEGDTNGTLNMLKERKTSTSDDLKGVNCANCGLLRKKDDTILFDKTFERVIFIDCTWFQVQKIYPDERLAGIQCIELKSQTTKFWRHQYKKPATYLATVEAMYYFLREYHDLYEPDPYRGQYDNLLFFFVYTYQKIRRRYGTDKILKAYEQRLK